jgi:PAS domain S-box-containing protein
VRADVRPEGVAAQALAVLKSTFMDTDRNLLFGVLALQADLIDAPQFIEACLLWTGHKDVPLADVLVERGWLLPDDRAHVDYLLGRKLNKHGGDARASLAALPGDVKRSLAALADEDILHSLASLPWPEEVADQGATVEHVFVPRERYDRLRLHATGGIGRVWLAHDGDLGRDVALKELRPERAGQAALQARFLQEAQITGQLEHPGIVPVYELARAPDGGQPFYTMRFVKGRTLSEAARAYHDRRLAGQADTLELPALLNAFVTVCNTVAYAHSRGVIHRDLKGQNVLLGDFGEVVVLDWGLAKLVGRADAEAGAPSIVLDGTGRDSGYTVQGQVLGTPAYMAPEQAAGRLDQIDRRTDVYGLGAILYEILTGAPPFTAATTAEVLRQVREEDPVPPRRLCPDVPAVLEAVCLRSLAKEPGARYASANDLAQEVQHWQEMQRRQAEEALRRQTQILQSVLNSIPDGVFVTDKDGRWLLCNPAAEAVCGPRAPEATPEQWKGRIGVFMPDMVTPCPTEDLPLVRALRGEEVVEAERFLRNPQVPEGIFLSVNASPIRDESGALRGAVSVFRNITQRKREEK